MNIEIKVKIETEHVDLELTQSEARALYEELKLMFEVKETVYIPFTNPLFLESRRPIPPYYIGDVPPWSSGTGCPPHITYSCGSTSKGENDQHEKS